MDPRLEEELEGVMEQAEISLMASQISKDVDLVLAAELCDKLAVKSALLARVIGQSENYQAAVIAAAVRKALAMGSAISGIPREDFVIAACEETDPEYHGVHDMVNALASADHEGMAEVIRALQASLEASTLAGKGKYLVHTFTLCGMLLRETAELRERELTEHFQKEDEGDSRS